MIYALMVSKDCHFLNPPNQSSAYVIYEWAPTALCSATTRKIVATKALTWLNKEHTFTYIQGFQNTMHVFFNVTQCSPVTIFCILLLTFLLKNKQEVLLRSTLISTVK